MALETREIPSLLFWILLAGVAYIVAAKITGEVSKQITAVFR